MWCVIQLAVEHSGQGDPSPGQVTQHTEGGGQQSSGALQRGVGEEDPAVLRGTACRNCCLLQHFRHHGGVAWEMTA